MVGGFGCGCGIIIIHVLNMLKWRQGGQ